MNLSLYIARRYLFSKKSHNAINIISIISACGIAVATMALVCTLSIFNGFTNIVAKSFSTFDPELKITPLRGKVFDPSIPLFAKLKDIEGIELISQSLEENALLRFGDKQAPVLIKGVSPEFEELADVKKTILNGTFVLDKGDIHYGVIGAELAMKLGARSELVDPIEVYTPKRDVKVNLSNPTTAFSSTSVFVGGVFALNQEKYDNQLFIIDIDQARKLFRYNKEVSSLDLKLKNGYKLEGVKDQIKTLLGSNYLVRDRFEQQIESFRMVNIEKWVTFLILAFILIIAVFNIVGSLSMLIIEKKDDIKILQNMGADNKRITRIFMFEGWLITLFGAGIGLIVGLVLCLVQQHFGILKLGDTPGAFIVDAYPVVVQPLDILSIAATVSLIGFLAVLYPVNNLRKQLK